MAVERVDSSLICPKCNKALIRYGETHQCCNCRDYSVTIDLKDAKERGLYRELWGLEDKVSLVGGNYLHNSDGTITLYIPSTLRGKAARTLYKSGIRQV